MESTTTDAATPRTLDAIAADARTALAERYAHPVVVVQEALGQVAVLGGAPLELVRDALAEGDAARVVELDPATLAWHAVPADGLRLWRQYGHAGVQGELVTELEAGDPPVQLVVQQEGWRLVRLLDGAQGWLDPQAPQLQPTDPPDELVRDTARIDREQFVVAALELDGADYVWGGTTDRGVDCSGIVQRAAWRAGGCWLPRHSRALLRVGARVKPSAVERGDVLVLQRDPKTYAEEKRAQLEAQARREQATGVVPSHGPAIHPMHVAIALSGSEVLHASRDAMRVVREPLASLRERYRVLGVRRLGSDTKESA